MFTSTYRLILTGSSTGGPGHIKKLLHQLSPGFSATLVIAQHLPGPYIESFVKQLTHCTDIPVKQVVDGMAIESAHIYVCSELTAIIENHHHLYFTQQAIGKAGYTPDINYLFESVAKFSAHIPTQAIIMTGIGDDGVRGALKLSQNNARIIAESEKTAIVDGMPLQARHQIKTADICTIDEIAAKINLFGS